MVLWRSHGTWLLILRVWWVLQVSRSVMHWSGHLRMRRNEAARIATLNAQVFSGHSSRVKYTSFFVEPPRVLQHHARILPAVVDMRGCRHGSDTQRYFLPGTQVIAVQARVLAKRPLGRLLYRFMPLDWLMRCRHHLWHFGHLVCRRCRTTLHCCG